MPLQIAPIGSHPPGEPNSSVFSRRQTSSALEPASVPLDVHDKRIYVEWDPYAPVTPLGQLVYFSQFLASAGLFRNWVSDCPLQYESPNAPSLNDLLGTIALSILAGNRRYAHVTALRGDTVNPQGLGMSRVLSEDAVRRAFAEEAAGPLENWQREHLWRSVEPVLKAPWICDIDVTVKTIYGRQEGAQVGYNPHKPGRPAHAYHTFFISRLRLALDVVVAPGKQFHSRAVSQKFWEWWERLSAQHRPYLLRGDCGFGNENFMVECERLNRQQRYLFRLRLSKGGVRLIEKLSGQGELFELMASIYDEPFADSSNIPTYLISQYARRFVKVVLSGDGGDELFGGYCWYAPLAASENIISTRFKWLILRILSRAIWDKIGRLRTYSIAAGLACKGDDIWSRSVLFNQHLGMDERRRLWAGRSQGVFASVPDEKYIPSSDVRGVDRAFYFDLTTYLPGDILVKLDRAAMANGLETRLPFLDRDVVEFALSLPATLKIKNEQTKIILRKAFSEYWPAKLATRDKSGFSVPAHIWLRRRDMQALARRVFRKNSALCHLLPGIDPSQASILRHSTWILLTLGTWLEHQNISA